MGVTYAWCCQDQWGGPGGTLQAIASGPTYPAPVEEGSSASQTCFSMAESPSCHRPARSKGKRVRGGRRKPPG